MCVCVVCEWCVVWVCGVWVSVVCVWVCVRLWKLKTISTVLYTHLKKPKCQCNGAHHIQLYVFIFHQTVKTTLCAQ